MLARLGLGSILHGDGIWHHSNDFLGRVGYGLGHKSARHPNFMEFFESRNPLGRKYWQLPNPISDASAPHQCYQREAVEQLEEGVRIEVEQDGIVRRNELFLGIKNLLRFELLE